MALNAPSGLAPFLGAEARRNPLNVRPLYDRLLVKRVQEEEATKGGIIIPDAAKEKPQEGRVIAAGGGKLMDDGKIRALTVAKGDRVLFTKFAGTEFQVDGEQHLIIREDDVLAILN
jgi:chaperonin GroES